MEDVGIFRRLTCSVRSENDNLRGSTVQGFRCYNNGLGSEDLEKTGQKVRRTLVGTFLQLSEVRSLLNEVENVLGECLIGDRPCLTIVRILKL